MTRLAGLEPNTAALPSPAGRKTSLPVRLALPRKSIRPHRSASTRLGRAGGNGGFLFNGSPGLHRHAGHLEPVPPDA
jgi:hypothetical protein